VHRARSGVHRVDVPGSAPREAPPVALVEPLCAGRVRADFERFAAGWQKAVYTILTIAGLSPAQYSADEAAEAMQTLLAEKDRRIAELERELRDAQGETLELWSRFSQTVRPLLERQMTERGSYGPDEAVQAIVDVMARATSAEAKVAELERERDEAEARGYEKRQAEIERALKAADGGLVLIAGPSAIEVKPLADALAAEKARADAAVETIADLRGQLATSQANYRNVTAALSSPAPGNGEAAVSKRNFIGPTNCGPCYGQGCKECNGTGKRWPTPSSPAAGSEEKDR
jgi:hypothetical protein